MRNAMQWNWMKWWWWQIDANVLGDRETNNVTRTQINWKNTATLFTHYGVVFRSPSLFFASRMKWAKKSNVNKDHTFYYFYASPTVCLGIRFEKWKEVPAKLLYYDSFFLLSLDSNFTCIFIIIQEIRWLSISGVANSHIANTIRHPKQNGQAY